jgi:hypothetical protein
MVYDNLKAVVDTIFTCKERLFNRRFVVLANQYLFEPGACTPASGSEKGQAENQVGNVREWLFTPLERFLSFAALNKCLATRCRELAARKQFRRPRSSRSPLAAIPSSLLCGGSPRRSMGMWSICCGCPAPASWCWTATPTAFRRDQRICDPWHYLPILERKPGALRNGVPFLDWDLPISSRLVRDRILKQPKGDRVFVELLMRRARLVRTCWKWPVNWCWTALSSLRL